MPDEKLGGRCRDSGCFKPAGHPDEHGISQAEIESVVGGPRHRSDGTGADVG